MYNGRHCYKEDYYKVLDLSNHFFSLLKNKNPNYEDYGHYLYKEIKEFDELLSDKFLLVLRNSKKNLEVDYQNLENRTRNIIEELLSNIAIDIKEHN